MKTLTVRRVPNDLHEHLAALARRNRLGLGQQVLLILDRSCRVDSTPVLDRAASLRRRLAGRPLGDSAAEVRAQRQN